MKCNLTSNLHQIYSSILQNYHNPCIFDLKTCFVFKQHFFSKHMVLSKNMSLFQKYPKIWSNHCIFSDNIKHILPGRDFSFLCQGNWWLESPQSCNTIGTIISIRYIWNLQRPKWLINCGLDCMIFLQNRFGKTPLVIHWLWGGTIFFSNFKGWRTQYIGKIWM